MTEAELREIGGVGASARLIRVVLGAGAAFFFLAAILLLLLPDAFAEWIGIPRRAFQGDHYDIPDEARPVAIEEGALVVTSREIVLALYAAGLRLRPAQRSAV